MIFINPPHLPRSPDHLWTEATLISKTCTVGYKQASVHENRSLFCVTGRNSAKCTFSPTQPSAIRSCDTENTFSHFMDGCAGWQSCHCHPISEPNASQVTVLYLPLSICHRLAQVCADSQRDQKKVELSLLWRFVAHLKHSHCTNSQNSHATASISSPEPAS